MARKAQNTVKKGVAQKRKPQENPIGDIFENPKQTPNYNVNVNVNDNVKEDIDLTSSLSPHANLKSSSLIDLGKNQKNQNFKKPTLEEIREYSNGKNIFCDLERFFDYFTANGWKQSNGNPIKDWQAALRNWNRNEEKFKQKSNSSGGFKSRTERTVEVLQEFVRNVEMRERANEQ